MEKSTLLGVGDYHWNTTRMAGEEQHRNHDDRGRLAVHMQVRTMTRYRFVTGLVAMFWVLLFAGLGYTSAVSIRRIHRYMVSHRPVQIYTVNHIPLP